eukprot:709548-Pelagomonas_calceolata.AAC.5
MGGAGSGALGRGGGGSGNGGQSQAASGRASKWGGGRGDHQEGQPDEEHEACMCHPLNKSVACVPELGAVQWVRLAVLRMQEMLGLSLICDNQPTTGGDAGGFSSS